MATRKAMKEVEELSEMRRKEIIRGNEEKEGKNQRRKRTEMKSDERQSKMKERNQRREGERR